MLVEAGKLNIKRTTTAKRGKQIMVMCLYLMLFFLLSSFEGDEQQYSLAHTLNQFVLWGLGPLVSAYIILPKMSKGSRVPKELLFYASLLLFALIGLNNVKDMDDYWRYFRIIISNFILMLAVFYSISDVEDAQLVFKAIGISCLVVVVISFFVDIGQFKADDTKRLNGVTNNSNGLANYARVGIMCALLTIESSKERLVKLICIGGILFFGYSIILSASRGNFVNMLMILAGYVCIKYFSGYRMILLVIALFLVGNFILTISEGYLQHFFIYERLTRNKSLDDVEGEGRVQLYKTTFDLISTHPFLGVGLNQYRLYSGGKISHSDIADIIVQLGLFAGAFYVSMYIVVIKHLAKVGKVFRKAFGSKYYSLLILFLCCDIIYGIGASNWFAQLQVVTLAVLVALGTPAVFNKTLKNSFRLNTVAQVAGETNADSGQ